MIRMGSVFRTDPISPNPWGISGDSAYMRKITAFLTRENRLLITT
jgi:hypothetical protein